MKDIMPSKTIMMIATSWDQMGDTGRKTGLWLEEFTAPYFAFKDAGYDIIVASPKGGKVPIDPTSLTDEYSTESTARYLALSDQVLDHSLCLKDCVDSDVAAIFYPGGHGPMWDLSHDPVNAKLIEKMVAHNKLVGAVCHGPAALLLARDPQTGDPWVKGKKINCFSDSEEEAVGLDHVVPFLLETRLRELGAEFSKGPDWTAYCVVDGNLITGQNPQSAAEVGKAMLKWLQEH